MINLTYKFKKGNIVKVVANYNIRGGEWYLEMTESQQISVESQNLGILNNRSWNFFSRIL